jgi:hypothetical protein
MPSDPDQAKQALEQYVRALQAAGEEFGGRADELASLVADLLRLGQAAGVDWSAPISLGVAAFAETTLPDGVTDDELDDLVRRLREFRKPQ